MEQALEALQIACVEVIMEQCHAGEVDLTGRPREGGFTGKAPSDEVELSGVVRNRIALRY
jgi:hypothetical protein